MALRGKLKRIDVLRHELKALRYILDNRYAGKLDPVAIPPREDFQSAEARAIYDAIMDASSRAGAEEAIGALALDDIDLESFLHLTGEHYYSYPALVRERAAAIRSGRLSIEDE